MTAQPADQMTNAEARRFGDTSTPTGRAETLTLKDNNGNEMTLTRATVKEGNETREVVVSSSPTQVATLLSIGLWC
jgi:hypothetical protein